MSLRAQCWRICWQVGRGRGTPIWLARAGLRVGETFRGAFNECLTLHHKPPTLHCCTAGCPAAVANLWDVTDKDIDRFSQAVLSSWISGGADSSSTGGSRADGRQPAAAAAGGAAAEADMSAAVAASRGACKLPYLVGAAPVCYGIPSHVFYS